MYCDYYSKCQFCLRVRVNNLSLALVCTPPSLLVGSCLEQGCCNTD